MSKKTISPPLTDKGRIQPRLIANKDTLVSKDDDADLNRINDDDLIGHKIEWNHHTELMLAKWCDQAKCFEWMHTEAYSMYDRKYKRIMILVGLLSIIGGVANVATDRYTNLPELGTIFGSITILIGGINFLQDKLAYNTLATQHNGYASTWGNIRRKIEEEINIPPNARKDCATFLKYIRVDINQVSSDGNSKIPRHLRKQCYTKFNSIADFDVPDICGQLEHTVVYADDHHIQIGKGTEITPLIDKSAILI
jgi:hypothetical protein